MKWSLAFLGIALTGMVLAGLASLQLLVRLNRLDRNFPRVVPGQAADEVRGLLGDPDRSGVDCDLPLGSQGSEAGSCAQALQYDIFLARQVIWFDAGGRVIYSYEYLSE